MLAYDIIQDVVPFLTKFEKEYYAGVNRAFYDAFKQFMTTNPPCELLERGAFNLSEAILQFNLTLAWEHNYTSIKEDILRDFEKALPYLKSIFVRLEKIYLLINPEYLKLEFVGQLQQIVHVFQNAKVELEMSTEKTSLSNEEISLINQCLLCIKSCQEIELTTNFFFLHLNLETLYESEVVKVKLEWGLCSTESIEQRSEIFYALVNFMHNIPEHRQNKLTLVIYMCTDSDGQVEAQFWTAICKTARKVFEDEAFTMSYRVKLVTCEYCFPKQGLELFELVKDNERLVHRLVQEDGRSKHYLLERF